MLILSMRIGGWKNLLRRRKLRRQFGVEGSKNLGPDGYNFFFIRKCWFFMKVYFLQFSNDFHGNYYLSKTIVSSFITIIPKKSNSTILDKLCPICLVGCLYKALSKLLAARLKT